jgi:hypothetical protein
MKPTLTLILILILPPQGGEEIDATKVDSTRKVEDYDEQTQAQIRKIMVCQILLPHLLFEFSP